MATTTIIYAALTVGVTGMVAAVILYFVSKVFYVEEDPRIDLVQDCLPNANCGGCGFAGCRAMAEAIVTTNDLNVAYCPGSDLEKIAEIMSLNAVAHEPQVSVVRCNGTCENAPARSFYDSALTCAFANTLFAGEKACPYGCLGCGDCVSACQFDAIKIDPATHLPVVDDGLCVGCKACANACPRNVIEIRDKGKNGRRVFVACHNNEKGAVAKKHCAVACIGCGKCARVCPFEAITIDNSLAYIDYKKCKACRKCVDECPSGAILTANFPPKKAVVVEKEEVVAEA